MVYNPLGAPIACTCPFRSSPQINGIAAGAGAASRSPATSCSPDARKFRDGIRRVGLVPNFGGRREFAAGPGGDARARALALLAEPVPAEQARRSGPDLEISWTTLFCSPRRRNCVNTPQLGADTGAGADQAPRSMSSAGNTLDAQLDFERDLQRAASLTPDHAEGVRVFHGKAQPNLTRRARTS